MQTASLYKKYRFKITVAIGHGPCEDTSPIEHRDCPLPRWFTKGFRFILHITYESTSLHPLLPNIPNQQPRPPPTLNPKKFQYNWFLELQKFVHSKFCKQQKITNNINISTCQKKSSALFNTQNHQLPCPIPPPTTEARTVSKTAKFRPPNNIKD